VLADLRREQAVPVLILTARDAVEDRVTAWTPRGRLLVKPFAFAELARPAAVLLRRGQAEPRNRAAGRRPGTGPGGAAR